MPLFPFSPPRSALPRRTTMDSLIPIGIITLLILLNGIFVAAEFAIVGAPRASIERLASEGNRVARKVSKILHTPRLQDRYIATAQLGITFASLGLGMYGEHTLADWIFGVLEGLNTPSWLAAHALASILSVSILTYFHIVVGEMVPKTLALQYAERTVLWITPPMLWIKLAFYPLVVGLNGIGNTILKLMGVDRQVASSFYLTPEELQYVIQESQAGGRLREESGRVLKDLLEFANLTAAEVVVPRMQVIGIPLNASPEELKEVMKSSRHSRYPVFEGDLDHILGVVHIKDLLRLLLDGQTLTRDNLRRVPYVPQTSSLEVVLAAMHRRRTHMAVVMDEYGGTAGIITIEDLFEEVVGEIDEGVPGIPESYRDSLGRMHVAGTLRLDEVGEQLGISLEHEEVFTVSGLILMLLERQPRVGDSVVYDSVQFEVTTVKGHGVGESIVTLLPSEEQHSGETL
jgi:CBS domain containing-hemolysin-like protein